MFRAELDESKTLLKITFGGCVGAAEAQRGAEQVAALLVKVKPGFRLLTDLNGLQQMDVSCEPAIDQVMELCNRTGVSTVVRVIPDPQKDIGMNIMSLFHYGRGVRIVTCESREEAARALGQ